MKIKTKEMSYDEVLALKPYARRKPLKQLPLLRWIIKWYSTVDLLRVGFQAKYVGMDKLGKDEPCLILMNHSCFTDMEIAGKLFGDRRYGFVCTRDTMMGKDLLMRLLGCIVTTKYITDLSLVKDMVYAVNTLKSSIIMYPEACYSFDGTATVLPDSLPKCLKLLKVPVVMVRTHGAFLRDPLYNGLQLRKTKIFAEVEYVLSPEDIEQKSSQELKEILDKMFTFDDFRWQQENHIRIREKFRADGLNRVLYKCPNCKTEGKMVGKGVYLTCKHCEKKYELTEHGFLKAVKGVTEFEHVPDWYQWERECVRQEILDGTYLLDEDVDISLMVDAKCLYKVGEGHLRHTKDGFSLTGCNGKLEYSQKPESSYTLNADFFWYEIGDVICIGDMAKQYYCFPKRKDDIVAKARLATEEMYKIAKENKKARRAVKREPAKEKLV